MNTQIPMKCPECGNKLRTIARCKTTRKAKTTLTMGFVIAFLVPGILGAIEIAMFNAIHLKLFIFIFFVICSVTFSIFISMNKMTHLKCNKCKWEEQYLVKSKHEAFSR